MPDAVVPLPMEGIRVQVHGGQFGVGEFDPLSVFSPIYSRFHGQAVVRHRRSDQLHDHVEAGQRLALPID